MPKGGKKRDYDKEIREAAERMKKRPESLKAARDSDRWISFLENIGINPEILDSDNGLAFWEEVREVIQPPTIYYDYEELEERGIKREQYERKDTGKSHVIFRGAGGRFVSGKKK